MTEHDRMSDEPLDEVLADAVRNLSREREAGAVLEERTVRVLRERGVLWRERAPRMWWTVSAAASIALFACGVAAGQWLGTRQTVDVLARQQQATLDEMAALVERTGSAYVASLARLAEAPESGQAAREAALQILHQAANEMVRLAPNDPVSVKILQGFDHAALQAPSPESRERRQIMWF